MGAELGEPLYREFVERINSIESAVDDKLRDVAWFDDDHLLGVTRSHSGNIEILIVGPELEATRELVKGRLVYDRWRTKDGEDIAANRILLPAEDEYDRIAALLCLELLERGVLDRPLEAFCLAEPVVEMVLRRTSSSETFITGLIGELLVLDGLAEAADQKRLSALLESWHGFQRSSRDIQLMDIGIEVKTTTGERSRHKIQGVRQIEIGNAVAGGFESALFLVSVGIKSLGSEIDSVLAVSLPELVDRILVRISDSGIEEPEHWRHRFVDAVARYGALDGAGYEHETMRTLPKFSSKWLPMFTRVYDMNDQLIKVIKSPDLIPFSMVDSSSIEFTIDLPDRIDGDINPIAVAKDAFHTIVQSAFGDHA